MKYIEMARNGHHIKRFHTLPTIGQQSVAEHSFGVAMLVLWLTEDRASGNLLRAALYHDLAEQATGDMPATSKWDNPELKWALDRAEDIFNEEHVLSVQITQAESLCLKWADGLELMCYCLEQRKLGNRFAMSPFNKVEAFLIKHQAHTRGLLLMRYLVDKMDALRDT